MFTKAIVVAFLSLALSASAAPAASSDCTLTVTARAATSTAALVSTGGKGAAAGGFGNSASGKGAATGKGATGASASSSAAASSASQGSAAAKASSATTDAATGSGSSSNLQTSLTLDSSLIQTGFEQNGQAGGDPEGAGQVASNTSTNNFINFCAQYSLPLTNGTQIKTGSCNAAPMGLIAATTAMPSSKFVNPANLATIPANTNFTIQMAINNLDTGNFVNPDTNYFAAPQTTNAQGLIVGHSHVVIEKVTSLTQTTPTDPTIFMFFKGLNDPAVNGQLSTTVAGGLPAGTYRMASINAAANHQPALVAVAQHGALDDMVYFTVSDDASAASSGAAASAAGATAAASSAASSAVSSSAAASSAAASTGAKGASGAATGKTGAAAGGSKEAGGKGKRWYSWA